MVTDTLTAGQDFTVPKGTFSLDVELEGERGGGSTGGDGGRVTGTLTVTPGDLLYIRESQGGSGDEAGGASIDIRRGGTALADRIAVAAGGGGGENADSVGGAGGADTGEDGDYGGSIPVATGGSQSAGGDGGGDGSGFDGEDGSLGTGGDGGIDSDGAFEGAGGGAGYYGGGGGAATDTFGNPGGSGAGGSNYDDGLGTTTANERGTSIRSYGDGGLVTITYTQTPGAENLQITNTTDTSNTLDWDAPTLPPEVDSIDQYRVYRDTDTGTDRADYTEVGTTATVGFDDTGLDNGIEYHYRIGADLFVPEAEYTITITGFREV